MSITEGIKAIECVIFDMDGVIFDSESIWKIAFREATLAYGFDLTEIDRQHTCGMDEESIRRELKERFPHADIDGYRDLMRKRVRELSGKGVPVKPGFEKLMTLLRATGKKAALATSSERMRACTMFAMNGMMVEKLFASTVFGDEVSKGKPDPFIFIEAARKAGVDPVKCMVIEDSPNGIEAAASGGFFPVMIPDIIMPTEKEKATCGLIAESLSELYGILKKEWKIAYEKN